MERPNFDLLSFMEEEDEMGDLIQPEDLLAETVVNVYYRLFTELPKDKRSHFVEKST